MRLLFKYAMVGCPPDSGVDEIAHEQRRHRDPAEIAPQPPPLAAGNQSDHLAQAAGNIDQQPAPCSGGE
jgi:hypothetical protein